jgi:hypothetical protein
MRRIIERVQSHEYASDSECEELIYDGPEYSFLYWPNDNDTVAVVCSAQHIEQMISSVRVDFSPAEICGLRFGADADILCPVCWAHDGGDLTCSVFSMCGSCARRVEDIRKEMSMRLAMTRALPLPPELTSIISCLVGAALPMKK